MTKQFPGSLRISTGADDALDTFWVTMLNKRGQPILGVSGGEFRIELRSPVNPEMQALQNVQEDRITIQKLRLRKEFAKANQDAPLTEEQIDDRIYDFVGRNLTETTFETVVAAVKAWENFPALLDPVTGKRMETQPPEPECNRETSEAFCRDNPDMFLQLKRAFNDQKNYLRESEPSSPTNLSNTPGENAPSTSPNPMDTPSENT